jgi:hypothetical protein
MDPGFRGDAFLRMGAILWCGVGRLIFAASVQQLATRIDQIMLSSAEVAAKAPFAPIAIIRGVLAEEAMRLFAQIAKAQSPRDRCPTRRCAASSR